MERAKALLSHTLPGATLVESIVSLAERYVKTRVGAKSKANCKAKTRAHQSSTSAAEGTGCITKDPFYKNHEERANHGDPSDR